MRRTVVQEEVQGVALPCRIVGMGAFKQCTKWAPAAQSAWVLGKGDCLLLVDGRWQVSALADLEAASWREPDLALTCPSRRCCSIVHRMQPDRAAACPVRAQVVLSKGVCEGKILFLSLIAAPEGIHTVCNKFPRVKVITSEIDEGIDESTFQVVPGEDALCHPGGPARSKRLRASGSL